MTERLDARVDGHVARAAAILDAGGLVAFPTETVYGLGARADRSDAVRAIFAAKGRPSTNPLIVHVASVEAAAALATGWGDEADRLARAFWPGPVTLVIAVRAGAVAPEVTAGGVTVGIRVPEHPVARALLAAVHVPIAAPSANRSSSVSPTTAAHVLKDLDGRIDAVLDGGPSKRGIESTIVDVTRTPAVILRPGAVSLAAIAGVVAVRDGGHRLDDAAERAAAPGGFARHYAPRARVVIVAAERVAEEVGARRRAGERVGALERAPASVGEAPREELADDPAGYARDLYAALHRLDDARCDVVVAAALPEGDAWAALRDRLRRASS